MDMYQKREMRKNKKMEENTKSLPSASINWYPGHMAKTLREIKEDIKLVDIVVIVLDARVPFASLNLDVYEIVKAKTVIMVFNKADLANSVALKKAEEKYKAEGCYTVRTNSMTGEGIDILTKTIRNIGEKVKYGNKTSDSYKLLKKVYRILIVGIPNVGKSSLINRISGKKSAEVGNKPGVTKQKQWIKVARDIELMDTPGLLSKNISHDGKGIKLALAGTIKDDVVDMEILALELINILTADRLYKAMLKDRYGIGEEIESLSDFEILEVVGRKRGALLKGDSVDVQKAARIIIEDYRIGKIGKISLE